MSGRGMFGRRLTRRRPLGNVANLNVVTRLANDL